MLKKSTYVNDDMVFCLSATCRNTKCPHNQSNMLPNNIYYGRKLRYTKDCPLREKAEDRLKKVESKIENI